MEDDLKECRNNRCRRFGVLVERPTSNRCSECNAKLKRPSWRSKDQPPLLDLAPDARQLKKGTNMTDSTNGKLIEKGKDRLLSRKEWMAIDGNSWAAWDVYIKLHGLQTYTEFSGQWNDYQLYLKTNNVGPAEDDMPSVGGTQGSYYGTTPSSKKANDTFSCDPDINNMGDKKGCPLITAKTIVEIPDSLYARWVYLAKAFSTEWIAYLKGHQEEDGKWIITDHYFPRQRCQSAHVDVEDGETIQDGTIGSVHSHVGMSAFFSGEDEKHFNHPVEMVINRAGDIKAAVRVKLDCARFTRVDGQVLLSPDDEETALIVALKEKIITTASSSSSSGHSHKGFRSGEGMGAEERTWRGETISGD